VAGRLTLREGDAIISRCCGGGGYGNPDQREAERVLADVHEGLISRARARDVYGIEIDGAGGRA
jgi:N-methylhydantoinase B